MASLTYVALRNIEPTGYSKAGTDISASGGANDWFASVTTDLSGLADNDWFLVSGFANAANNGWFQANGASVAAKITQDTSTTLVNEAAGSVISIVGYKRGYNQQYAFDFGLEAADLSHHDDKTKHQP